LWEHKKGKPVKIICVVNDGIKYQKVVKKFIKTYFKRFYFDSQLFFSVISFSPRLSFC
jgi:hypothetical protein